MKIQLNGREHELAKAVSVAELLQMLRIPSAGTAVVVGGAVIATAEHPTRTIAENDRVDIVRAIGGG